MHQWQRRPDLPDSPVAARVKLLFEFKEKLSASRGRTFFEALFDQVTEGSDGSCTRTRSHRSGAGPRTVRRCCCKSKSFGKERIYVRTLPPALYVGVRDRIGKFVFSPRKQPAPAPQSGVRSTQSQTQALRDLRNSDRRRTIKPASLPPSR